LEGVGRSLIEVLSQYLSRGTKEDHKESHVKLDGVSAAIRTNDPPNTNLERYRCTNPVGFRVEYGGKKSLRNVGNFLHSRRHKYMVIAV
jgi:hypothetical protein